MDGFSGIARVLILTGLLLLAMGLGLAFFKDIPFGKLPGDILIKRKNWGFYFPVSTSLIISIILSVIMFLFFRGK